jgi:hypothetical protein
MNRKINGMWIALGAISSVFCGFYGIKGAGYTSEVPYVFAMVLVLIVLITLSTLFKRDSFDKNKYNIDSGSDFAKRIIHYQITALVFTFGWVGGDYLAIVLRRVF